MERRILIASALTDFIKKQFWSWLFVGLFAIPAHAQMDPPQSLATIPVGRTPRQVAIDPGLNLVA